MVEIRKVVNPQTKIGRRSVVVTGRRHWAASQTRIGRRIGRRKVVTGRRHWATQIP
jgi:hypothetical protein